MNHVRFHERDIFIYICAIAFSIFLSAWLDIRETVINPDGICYVISAEAVGKLGIANAMQLCGQAQWPFYSVLIYGLVQISHFSYVTAAYLWNTLFTLTTVCVFILLVKELGGHKRTLWLAALVILFAHGFNSTREYIIRDHGFWAFYLGSLFFLLRYFKKPSWILALAFSLSLFIAALFRIEGAIFLVVLPFASFFNASFTINERFKSFFLLNQLAMIICVCAGGYLIAHPEKTMAKLGRVSEIVVQIQHGFALISERYQHSKEALAQYVLTSDSVDDAGVVLCLMLLVWYVQNVITNLSGIYALLVFYCWQQKAVRLNKSAWLVIAAYLFINIGITFAFLLEHLFLSKRYLMALSLVFMLFVPFALDKLWENVDLIRHRLLLIFATIFIAIAALGGILDFGYSKAYVHQAGDWLAKNVPPTASLYANDYQLMYYSEHFGDSIFKTVRQYVHTDIVAHEAWKQYDYIALRLSKKEDSKAVLLQQRIKLTPSTSFSNKRGDRVVIYKVK